MISVHLKPGREASVLRHHPWVFSGAIARIEGAPQAGEIVRVLDSRGQLLGVGGFSPGSQIRVRLFAYHDTHVEADFIRQRLEDAVAKRRHLLGDPERSACRLVYAESDGLPGLIVDRYSEYLVLQCTFVGMEQFKPVIVDELRKITGIESVYERSDSPVRRKEGLEPAQGALAGLPPPEAIIIRENGMSMAVDVMGGQKTGYYLDQVDNRSIVAGYCRERRVLNCFAYTGAFSVAALRGGASHVTSADSSQASLARAQANVLRNDIAAEKHQLVEANVFELLRQYQEQGQTFDLIILDPPRLADGKQQVVKAARAYKDLSLQAARLLPPGGLLVTFSCSGAIDMNLFQKITADALLDANRQGEIVRYLHQSSDHPVALSFPESQYLKGLVCRID